MLSTAAVMLPVKPMTADFDGQSTDCYVTHTAIDRINGRVSSREKTTTII